MNLAMRLSCSTRPVSFFRHGAKQRLDVLTPNHGYLLRVTGNERQINAVNRKNGVGNLAIDSHEDAASVTSRGGIGITDFFQGRSIFITGATGLVGSAIIEKLLRSTDVTKIYVLVRAKNQEDAFDRLEKEIVSSELFKLLQEKHGKDYRTFIKEKLIPVVGDIRDDQNLGIDSDAAIALMKNVNVIIHSAAGTTLNGRLLTTSGLSMFPI